MNRWFDIYFENEADDHVTFNNGTEEITITLVEFVNLSWCFLPFKQLDKNRYKFYEVV